MCHKKYRLLRAVGQHQQQGFLLPVALFIIVVVGSMAITISNKLAQSTSSYVTDALSIQTFYAAESGAEAGLHELFFSDTDRQLVDGRCANMNISQALNVAGLNNCTVTVNCTCRYENNALCDENDNANYAVTSSITHSFYQIESLAQCGVEPMISQHLIEVGSSL